MRRSSREASEVGPLERLMRWGSTHAALLQESTSAMAILIALFFAGGCSTIGQKFLFYPAHHSGDNGLTPWRLNGEIIGYFRMVASPQNVWLLLHGNGGQAVDRVYALPDFAPDDLVFVLEYPGYGTRAGTPSRQSIDTAASNAYTALRKQFPHLPVCVAGESIGSGPASALARQPVPPDKIVLVVPFDTLNSVAHEHAPCLPVDLILGNSWDNISALSHYSGPIDIFAAEQDLTIPIHHAETLSRALPRAKFHRISGGHNDWSQGNQVEFRFLEKESRALPQ